MSQGDTHPMLRFPPGHYYSPLPDPEMIEREAGRLFARPTHDDGVDMNPAGQKRLLAELGEYARDFDWGPAGSSGNRFYVPNDYYSFGDAQTLYTVLRRFRPRRIIEVGSGYSSALMLDTNERHFTPRMELTFIEPYPERLESLLRDGDRASATVLVQQVQSVPVERFETLGENDILFIDSSHVSKIGSDVNYLFFDILPRLREGVLVHIHDVFFPLEYPLDWLREGRAWNEMYLLRAFLQYNSAFEVMFHGLYLWHTANELLLQHLPLMPRAPGGSMWLRKVKRTR